MKVYSSSKSLNFKAGLTSQMRKEIAGCDPNKVSYYLSRNSIQSNFNNDKTVAWCVLKCLELLKIFNKKFNLNLGFPKGIFVEDFNKLNIENQNALGFINFAPTKLYLNNDTIISEKAIFFNRLNWDNIDKISDENYEFGFTTTDFFLETFLHEFSHVIHEDNLLNKKNGRDVIIFIQKMLNPKFIKDFQTKYKIFLDSKCLYASENPLETVACDISNRILNNIDKNALTPKNDFTLLSPYKNISLFQKFIMSCNKKQEKNLLLNKIWQGNL